MPKKLIVMLMLLGLAIPVFAQESKKAAKPEAKTPKTKPEAKKPDDKKGKEIDGFDDTDIPGPDEIGNINIGRKKVRQFSPRLKKAFAMMKEMHKFFKAKDYKKAREIALKLVKIMPESGSNWYNLACAESRLGKHKEALKNLKISIERGYDGMLHMERDEDLKALHKYEGFKKLLARRDEIHRGRAEKILKVLKRKYGSDYLIEIDHERKLIFATNVDRDTLERLKQELTKQTKAMWSGDLFDNKFEKYITVIVPKPNSVKALKNIGGFYRPDKYMLVARSIGYVMRHEFTHALHFADIALRGQRHPIWVLEGMATLYESSEYNKEGKLIPGKSMRLYTLKRYQKAGKLFPIKEFLKMDHRTFMDRKKVGLAYAQSRYFMKFIYDQGKLKQWYDAYCKNHKQDKTGQKAIEQVFGVTIEEFEKQWHAYIKKEKLPPMGPKANQPYLGIGSKPTVDGLEILRVVKGSGAFKAGLKKGDVMVGIDGKRIIDRSDLLKITRAAKVNQVLKIRIRRDGKYIVVPVKLTPKPASADGMVPRRPRLPRRKSRRQRKTRNGRIVPKRVG